MKIKTSNGYRFVKELGGAIKRTAASKTAKFLDERNLLQGRILDYGCGFGFDADHYGWEGYDPHYRPKKPVGLFDTIICNGVANMLTRKSRQILFQDLADLLTENGKAYIAVSRNIPKVGKAALRKRIQNYVVLTLPSIYHDDDVEIYQLRKVSEFQDLTTEVERRM